MDDVNSFAIIGCYGNRFVTWQHLCRYIYSPKFDLPYARYVTALWCAHYTLTFAEIVFIYIDLVRSAFHSPYRIPRIIVYLYSLITIVAVGMSWSTAGLHVCGELFRNVCNYFAQLWEGREKKWSTRCFTLL